MLADFFTKPLQGNLFRRFRDVILGYSHVDTLKRDITTQLEERVGNDRAVACAAARPRNTSEKTPVTGQQSGANTWADVARKRVAHNRDDPDMMF